MTTTVAPIGLVYDGVDLQESDLGLFLEITQGLDDSGDVRGIDVVVPGADGRVARPRRFDHRRILLAGHVLGNGATSALARIDYRTKRRGLAQLFDPAKAPASLVVTLEDGAMRAILCRPLSIAATERIPSEWASLSVELEAVEEWTDVLPALLAPDPAALVAAVPVPAVSVGVLLAPDPVALPLDVPVPTVTVT